MRGVEWSGFEDETLVTASQQGNLGAFDQLASRYRGPSLLLADGILRNREQAEDVVQDSLLAAFKALPQLREPDRFVGWLGAIVKRRALRYKAREPKGALTLDEQLDALLIRNLPSLREAPAIPELYPELANLPPEYAEIALLYYGEEWSVGAISDFLKLPETTVKWRLHKTREKLRNKRNYK
jgi:RNA polymerase sigma-70 factor, ECF subfamily